MRKKVALSHGSLNTIFFYFLFGGEANPHALDDLAASVECMCRTHPVIWYCKIWCPLRKSLFEIQLRRVDMTDEMF